MDAKELGAAPAYPNDEVQGDCGEYETFAVGGLTKREAFAMAAMQGEIAAEGDYATEFVLASIGAPLETVYDISVHWPAFIAKRAVQHADALLAELAKDGAP